MKREYYKWHSRFVKKELEILVFGHAGAPVLFFPTRTARFYDYENWRIIDAMKEKIEAGYLQIFCVDSTDVDSFYNAEIHPSERIVRYSHYESYIVHEVIPFIKKLNKNKYRIVAGCSLGAYHAMNTALKHPQHFNKVVGMSGRYDLGMQIGNFRDLFDGYKDENIYFNTPTMFIPNLSDEKIIKTLKKMKIVFVIGKDDPFFESNVLLSNALSEKEICNILYVWNEEAHRSASLAQNGADVYMKVKHTL